jgi:hypothetical protein
MFDGYKDEFNLPTEADAGVFIPQKEIETWWKSLQKKYPKIYASEVSAVLFVFRVVYATAKQVYHIIFILLPHSGSFLYPTINHQYMIT